MSRTKKLLAVCGVLFAVSLAMALLTPGIAGAQAAGQAGAENFKKTCAACHTIGGGMRVGPDLKGVSDRRTEAWLVSFIASAQKMIDAGDPDAVAIRKDYTLVMPDNAYTAEQIKEILAYIKTGGDGSEAPSIFNRPATDEDIRMGEALFQGKVRLEQGGPACNSCHDVRNDAVIGGGVLAKELTDVFGRMGGPGIHAILGKPPFPVMEEAYKNRPLTDDEVFALVAFLQDSDKKGALQAPSDYGIKLVLSGGGVFVVLMGLYTLWGRRRKKFPVNHAIFERQVKSQ